MAMRVAGLVGAAVLAVMTLLVAPANAQSRIKTMPGYDDYQRVAPQIQRAVKLGAINAEWAEDSKSFDYMFDGKRWRFDISTRTAGDAPPRTPVAATPRGGALPAPPPMTGGVMLARGRGGDANVLSPDRQWRAFSRDNNMWLAPAEGGEEKQLTTDGGAKERIRHGVGSYVYLEEFSVSSPVWWSPDGKRLAWMRYDESKVDDYFLQLEQTRKFSSVLTEAYPHPGAENPVADLLIYDVVTGQTKTMNVRDGAPFSNEVVGHYVWTGQWTKDGSEFLVRRADRLQKVYDLAACAPAAGRCRTVVRESRPATWANGQGPRFLEDGKRFIWTSERTDFRNLYLYDLTGKQIAQLTNCACEVADIVKVDEKAGWLWYTARSGENHMLVQLHRVRLTGKDDVRLTDPKLTHRVDVSPDGQFFVDVEQAYDRPPVSRLRDLNGKLVAELAASDTSAFDALGLKPAELFTFTAADRKTPLYGMLQFPSNFDPSRKYPVLVSVYGGPSSGGLTETFQNAQALAEYGFLYLRVDARTNAGRGRKVLDPVYKQLGVAEIDDIAAGIRATWSRPYVDRERVGIYGTSYGGTVAATMILRHPEVVKAAVANSPVTDYRLYDTAYAERYLGLPQTDGDAYDRSAVLTYANQLRDDRDLMIYYGTSDDNVHPKNSLQFIRALQVAQKSFEVQVGPDKGHTAVDQNRMMEFFIDKLAPNGAPAPAAQTVITGPNSQGG